MADERRYGDDEVAEIFRTAASERRLPAGSPAPSTGLTLTELQAIGREAGLEPARIAEAAAAMELRGGGGRRTSLGMPVGVERTVDLPRAPTDAEWEMLVSELRATFRAKGRVTSAGGLREWSNGNLHAFVEPTPTGHRLRLATTKGNAMSTNFLGGAGLVAGIATLTSVLLAHAPVQALPMPLLILLAGGITLPGNAIRLRRWAEEREAQMEAIAARARALVGEPASLPDADAPHELPAGTG